MNICGTCGCDIVCGDCGCPSRAEVDAIERARREGVREAARWIEQRTGSFDEAKLAHQVLLNVLPDDESIALAREIRQRHPEPAQQPQAPGPAVAKECGLCDGRGWYGGVVRGMGQSVTCYRCNGTGVRP